MCFRRINLSDKFSSLPLRWANTMVIARNKGFHTFNFMIDDVSRWWPLHFLLFYWFPHQNNHNHHQDHNLYILRSFTGLGALRLLGVELSRQSVIPDQFHDQRDNVVVIKSITISVMIIWRVYRAPFNCLSPPSPPSLLSSQSFILVLGLSQGVLGVLQLLLQRVVLLALLRARLSLLILRLNRSTIIILQIIIKSETWLWKVEKKMPLNHLL